jgi:endogenous inhibitor of DNA gyrase (YacG/DUF329 family)
MKSPLCPICGRPRSRRDAPFCSPVCADADLANWLGGKYRIPDPDSGGEDDETPPVGRA